MPPRATAHRGRVVPFPWSGDASPPDALRGLLHSLAVRIHQGGGSYQGEPWCLSGALLGAALAPESPLTFPPSARRRMERAFLVELLAHLHQAERANEVRAKLDRAGRRPRGRRR